MYKAIFTFILILTQFHSKSQSENTFVNSSFIDTYTPKKGRFAQLNSWGFCFDSKKIEERLSKITEYREKKLDYVEFQQLNALEYNIYAFKYPESFYQSCSMIHTPDRFLEKIPAYLKTQGGVSMSTRQFTSLTAHRDSTIILLKLCSEKNKFTDGFLNFIVKANLFEIIPTIIQKSQIKDSHVNPYLLTTLCLLMKDDFIPFQKTKIYTQLYDTKYSQPRYKNHIPFTVDNYNRIIQLAQDYFEKETAQFGKFVTINGGSFSIGEGGWLKENHPINPSRKVELHTFDISKYEVTNEEFSQFVLETGYITLAEKNKNALVFEEGLKEFEWKEDTTASWRFPNGKSKGGIENKMNHPVTCISFIDALEYCKWADVRLPTIEEWEVAARANSYGKYFFADTNLYINMYANIWKGKSHKEVDANERHITTSPTGSYKPNPYGLFDIYGNVFEFCSNLPSALLTEGNINIAATRGGSWWCSKSSCGYFNSVDIGKVRKEASFSNNGFRVVRK